MPYAWVAICGLCHWCNTLFAKSHIPGILDPWRPVVHVLVVVIQRATIVACLGKLGARKGSP